MQSLQRLRGDFAGHLPSRHFCGLWPPAAAPSLRPHRFLATPLILLLGLGLEPLLQFLLNRLALPLLAAPHRFCCLGVIFHATGERERERERENLLHQSAQAAQNLQEPHMTHGGKTRPPAIERCRRRRPWQHLGSFCHLVVHLRVPSLQNISRLSRFPLPL